MKVTELDDAIRGAAIDWWSSHKSEYVFNPETQAHVKENLNRLFDHLAAEPHEFEAKMLSLNQSIHRYNQRSDETEHFPEDYDNSNQLKKLLGEGKNLPTIEELPDDLEMIKVFIRGFLRRVKLEFYQFPEKLSDPSQLVTAAVIDGYGLAVTYHLVTNGDIALARDKENRNLVVNTILENLSEDSLMLPEIIEMGWFSSGFSPEFLAKLNREN